jgi:hypothetical protein
MQREPVVFVHVLLCPARVQVNSNRQLHRRHRKLSKFAKRKKSLARPLSRRTWTKKRWTSPVQPVRYECAVANSTCARSSRLTTATTLQIASFDPSVHRSCLRKCNGPSRSRWSDYTQLQMVSSRGLPAGRSSRRSPLPADEGCLGTRTRRLFSFL